MSMDPEVPQVPLPDDRPVPQPECGDQTPADRAFKPLLGLIGLLSAVLTGVLSGGKGFFLDDFWTLGEARDNGLSLHYLVLPVTGDHIHPGRRLADWLILTLGPEWWMAAAFMTLCLAATVVLAGLAVREISDSALVGLACAVTVGGSIGFLRSVIWWSSGVQVIPAALLSMAMILALLRWQETRSTLMLCLTASSFLGALLFFDKYASMAFVALALLLVASPAERSLTSAQVRDGLRVGWPMVAILVGVAAFVTVVWLIGTSGSRNPLSGAARGADAGRWADYVVSWWTHGIGGIMLNANTVTGPNLALDPSPSPDSLAWLGLLLLGMLAAATIRGSRAAWLWGCAILIIMLNAVVVGVGRLGTFDAAYLLDPRYQDLNVITLILLVPAAWRASGKPSLKRGGARAAALIAVAALGAGWVINGSKAMNAWSHLPEEAGAYAQTMRSSVNAVSAVDPGVTILGEAAPEKFVGPLAISPYNSTGRLLTLIAPDARLGMNEKDGPAIRFTADGRSEFIDGGPQVALSLSAPICGRAAPGADWHNPGAFNVTAVGGPGAGAGTGGLLLTVTLSAANSRGEVAVTPLGSPYPSATLPLATYPTGMRLIVGPKAISQYGSRGVRISLWKGARACVSSVASAPIPK